MKRAEAARARQGGETSDPEYDQSIRDSEHYRLEMLKEQYRHAQAMHDKSKGYIGRLIGGESNAASFASLFAVVAGFLTFVGCLVASHWLGLESSTQWGEHSKSALAFAATALAFLWGKGSKKD